MIDPTQRFSTRVDNYVKYRPGYPAGVLATLQEDCSLTPASVIADIGSGTGILTQLFLQNGNPVFAVEPNNEMRYAAERLLSGYASFYSLPARAEATELPDRSVDFIVAGQAFHWFDQQKARLEFTRILRPGDWVMLVWNEREAQSSPFLVAYEALLQRYASEYPKVDHRQVDHASLSRFYGPGGFQTRNFSHQQEFDLAGIQGRLLSSSYSPEPGHPNHAPMLAELAAIFDAHQVDGRVAFAYTTKMYYGQLS
jgi:SAM-dependent methyltransferase